MKSNPVEPDFPNRAPNCLQCVHFKVTWDPGFPRSCRLFGVKCRNLPSQAVFLSTGKHCFSFVMKEGLK
ncbi:MAG: hypothetical protein LBT39_04845 [Treponema sp.]|nr:hypothetical protein [Treponema sp.]